MKRVWTLSTQVLENNQSLFNTDFEENKKALDAVSVITSKKLRNQIAGCITKIKNNEQKAMLVSQPSSTASVSIEAQTTDESD